MLSHDFHRASDAFNHALPLETLLDAANLAGLSGPEGRAPELRLRSACWRSAIAESVLSPDAWILSAPTIACRVIGTA